MLRIDGGKLQIEIIRRGWTVKDLAKKAGVSQPTIRRILRGAGKETLRTKTKIALALGLDCGELTKREAE